MPMTTEYAQSLVNAGLSYKTAFEQLIADLKNAATMPPTMRVDMLSALASTADLTRLDLMQAGLLLGAENVRLRSVTGTNRRARRYMARRRAAQQEAPAPQPAPYKMPDIMPGMSPEYNAALLALARERYAPASAPQAPSASPAPYIPAVPTTPVAPPQPPGGAHTGGAQPSAQGAQPIDYTALAESAAPTPELEALKNLFE